MRPRLLFLTQYDETGASSRIRIYQFLPLLEADGFQCDVRPLITGDSNRLFTELATARNPFKLASVLLRLALKFGGRYRDVIDAWKYDAVVVQKDVLPFGLRTLLFLGQKNVAYEFDDAIWVPNAGAGGGGLPGRLLAWYRKRLLVKILRRARLVIVDNSYLARFASQYCAHTVTLSAPIDTQFYDVARHPAAISEHDPGVFGWIGSPSTTYLLHELLPSLERLSLERPITLYNVGGLPLQSARVDIHNVRWSPQAEKEVLAKIDVGLMPLDDRPFNRGRLGYKIVQYFAAGVPVLAADVGLNRELVTPEQNGYLFSYGDAEDFARKASRLLDEPALRKRLGANAKRLSREKFDVRVLARHLSRSLSEITRKAA